MARLSEMVEPDTARASSLLLVDRGRFLLAGRPLIYSEQRVLLRLTGVGGWAEGSETFSAAALRESIEETGSAIRLIEQEYTLIVHSPDDIDTVAITDEPGPVALVYRRFGTTPFEPWSEEYQSVAPIAVYAATLDDTARIVARDEHPLFMWIYPEQLISLAEADEPLEFLVADGAQIFGQLDFDTSRTIVRLTDSIQALVTALGPRSYGLLTEIAQMSGTACLL
ncbi:MAG TPA: hypothetical protein DCX80_05315 [Chloroflexi bacterium]|nr:hypothetical protein [Chloroflexota bacterium]